MKKLIKENYKFIITIIILIIVLNIRFPYCIDAPGGINNVSNRISINGYKSKGSFNLTYVTEYEATIPTLLFSFIKKDLNIIKEEDVVFDNETLEESYKRDKLLLEESNINSIYVAYKYAKKDINVLSNDIYVAYVLPAANTNLTTGDKIVSINGIKISSKSDVLNSVNDYNIGDKLDIKVINNKKVYNRYAYVYEYDNRKVIGFYICSIKQLDIMDDIKLDVKKNEYGSSGGLVSTLYIYDSLTKEDLTHGYTIVGTGTIDEDGNVGSIGGVEYKLKSAVKEKADIFIVPKGENYTEALKLKKQNNYKIKIIGVSTFEEAVKYLEEL